MSLHDERPYRPKIRGRRVYGRDELSFLHLRAQLGKRQRGRATPAGRARVAARAVGVHGRRVIIKAWYVRVGGGQESARSAKTFLRYMEKEGAARDGGQSILYGPSLEPAISHGRGTERSASVEDTGVGTFEVDSVSGGSAGSIRAEAERTGPDLPQEPQQRAASRDAELEHEVLEPIPGEKHQFRIVISPDDGDRLDLTRFVNELMQQVERDVGQPLIWAAANHYDTDDPHTHVVIRGVDRNGNHLRFDRAYISRVWRERAEELATRELGPRTDLEYRQQLERETQQGSLTSLDRGIVKRATEGVVAVKDLDKFQRERLKVLGEMGLARELDARRWMLAPGWQQKLREHGERGDKIKQLHKAVPLETGDYRIVDRSAALPRASAEGREVTGRVVAIGLIDASPGRMYAIVESEHGRGYYVPLWRAESAALRRGALVTLRQDPGSWRKPVDAVLDVLSQRQAVLDAKEVRAAIENRLHEHAEVGTANRVSDRAWQLRPGFRAGAASRTGARGVDVFLARFAGSDGRLDVAKAVQSAVERVAELQALGLVDRVNGVQRLKRGWVLELETRDRTEPRWRVSLRQQRLTLEQQVTYLGPVWLDVAKARGSSSFAADVVAAADRRQEFLRTCAIAVSDLSRIERQRVAEFHARQLNRQVAQRANGFQGTVQSIYEAHGGTRYAIVANAEQLIVVRAGARLRAHLGREVEVSIRISEYDGKPKLEVVPSNARARGSRGPTVG